MPPWRAPKANASVRYGQQAAGSFEDGQFVGRSRNHSNAIRCPVLLAFEVLIEELLKNGSPELLQETSEG